MASLTEQSEDERTWPSVHEAYGFVLPSYQLLTSRFEAADTRLTALLTFGATVTLGVPLFAKTVRPDAAFGSPWFVAGILFFICAAAFGIVGRTTGAITLVNPMILYTDGLHKSPWLFKKDAIFRAGEHFRVNVAAVAAKGTYAMIVTVALMCEVMTFAVWLAQ